ncbi:MAG TPA: DUF5719 family protein [Acidimicrobiales bacterium]|nr:DUF5719 family protein [Acidimicrobiales bacterium]
MTARRIPILALIVVVIVALVMADRASTTHPPRQTAAAVALLPVASPSGAVSTAFYCAGGGATAGAVFDTTLVIANPGSTTANVEVTTYPAALPGDAAGVAAVTKLHPVTRPVAVGGRTRAEVHLADLQASPFAAALVETSDGDIAVERRVADGDGTITSTSPCSSTPSDTWYLPTGTTTRDAHEVLALFNPFPVDAVVDITFQTSDGFRNPPELQSLPVPGGQLRLVDVSASAPRIEQLAATVVALSGRVVADRLQQFDGTDPKHPAGFASTAGAPKASSVWTFGEGQVGDGLREVFTIVNPSAQAAAVQLEAVLDDPASNGAVDPIPVSVPARGYAQVVINDQTRIPANVGHSVTVRSTNGIAVVAERVVTASAPDHHRGYGPALGAPVVATRWLFAHGQAATGKIAERIVVVNPSTDSIAHVRVTALAQGEPLAIDGLQGVEVPAGGRLAIDLLQHVQRPDLPLLVESDTPVVVERALYAGKGRGISFAAGMPLFESVSLPPAPPPSTTTTAPGAPPPPASS